MFIYINKYMKILLILRITKKIVYFFQIINILFEIFFHNLIKTIFLKYKEKKSKK